MATMLSSHPQVRGRGLRETRAAAIASHRAGAEGTSPPPLAGKDATQDFEEIGHSNSAREMLKKYLIGEYAVRQSAPRAVVRAGRPPTGWQGWGWRGGMACYQNVSLRSWQGGRGELAVVLWRAAGPCSWLASGRRIRHGNGAAPHAGQAAPCAAIGLLEAQPWLGRRKPGDGMRFVPRMLLCVLGGLASAGRALD